MWMIELTMKTRAAETRMGSQRDAIGTIMTSVFRLRQGFGGTGRLSGCGGTGPPSPTVRRDKCAAPGTLYGPCARAPCACKFEHADASTAVPETTESRPDLQPARHG